MNAPNELLPNEPEVVSAPPNDKQLDNVAKFTEYAGGNWLFTAEIWTRMANKKRQQLFCNMAVMELTILERLIKDLPYDQVERGLAKPDVETGAGQKETGPEAGLDRKASEGAGQTSEATQT